MANGRLASSDCLAIAGGRGGFELGLEAVVGGGKRTRLVLEEVGGVGRMKRLDELPVLLERTNHDACPWAF